MRLLPAYDALSLRQDSTLPFDLGLLTYQRAPIDLGVYLPLGLPPARVNHYLVKGRGSQRYTLGALDSPGMQQLVGFIEAWARRHAILLDDRYCFITMDHGWLEIGQTLRDEGWHLDGLQGDEVPQKQAADIQFVWSDSLPTLFTTQCFDVRGLDPSLHNVFCWLERQIDPGYLLFTEPMHLYAMSTYHAHCALEAAERTFRKFIRISYTHVPITSVRMTVNPGACYDYRYHTTSGAIPAHLSLIGYREGLISR